jgi:hypothetical protein
MKPGYRALALPALGLGVVLCVGCGATNEEELKGQSQAIGQQPGVPEIKSYSEASKYMSQQQAERNAAARAAQKKPK